MPVRWRDAPARVKWTSCYMCEEEHAATRTAAVPGTSRSHVNAAATVLLSVYGHTHSSVSRTTRCIYIYIYSCGLCFGCQTAGCRVLGTIYLQYQVPGTWYIF